VLGLRIGAVRDGKKRFADTALAMSQAFTLCCTLDEAKAVREEVAFLQGVKVILTKKDFSARKRTDEARDLAIRQIISQAMGQEVPRCGIAWRHAGANRGRGAFLWRAGRQRIGRPVVD